MRQYQPPQTDDEGNAREDQHREEKEERARKAAAQREGKRQDRLWRQAGRQYDHG